MHVWFFSIVRVGPRTKRLPTPVLAACWLTDSNVVPGASDEVVYIVLLAFPSYMLPGMALQSVASVVVTEFKGQSQFQVTFRKAKQAKRRRPCGGK